jgi:hypothetical protein
MPPQRPSAARQSGAVRDGERRLSSGTMDRHPPLPAHGQDRAPSRPPDSRQGPGAIRARPSLGRTRRAHREHPALRPPHASTRAGHSHPRKRVRRERSPYATHGQAAPLISRPPARPLCQESGHLRSTEWPATRCCFRTNPVAPGPSQRANGIAPVAESRARARAYGRRGLLMQRCLRARAHAAACAASGLGERDRAAVRALTIRIVANQ